MESNRILPIVAGVVFVMLIVVGLKSCNTDYQDVQGLAAVPQPGAPDADSPADTIRTLTAEVAAIKSETQKLNTQSEQLLRQRHEIESAVTANLRTEMEHKETQKQSPVIASLTQQLKFFKTRLDELSAAQNDKALQNQNDIPIGFGLDGRDGLALSEPEIVWVEPLGAETDKQGNPVYIPATTGGLLKTGGDNAQGTTESYLQAANLETPKDKPVYTIPRNATLIGSTGMTAMIGRVPVNGAVEDPFPFKVIVGQENLAANGIEIPGLDGMIFTGKATGDWTLSCVRGQLISVTYVFSDGTIRTLSSDDNNSQLTQGQSQLTQNQNGGKRALGWISDRRGIPCVTGVRISNAINYLSGRILAAGAEAAAAAFSQSQVTNQVSASQGVTTSIITGDSGKYAMGRALSGGAEEIGAYLRERAAQSFDVIYVDTGSELAIHVDVELPIDYEPNGRKTSYAYYENDTAAALD